MPMIGLPATSPSAIQTAARLFSKRSPISMTDAELLAEVEALAVRAFAWGGPRDSAMVQELAGRLKGRSAIRECSCVDGVCKAQLQESL